MEMRLPRRRALLRMAAFAGAAAVTGCASEAADHDRNTGESRKGPTPNASAYDPRDGTGPAVDTDAARSPEKAWRYVHFGDAAAYVAVAASTPDNVWVLGAGDTDMVDTYRDEEVKPFLEHYDGRAWRTHPLPELPARRRNFALGTTEVGNVWLAMDVGVIDASDPGAAVTTHFYRWDGAKWRTLPPVTSPTDSELAPEDGKRFAAAGPDDAWFCTRGHVMYWNGSAWRDTNLPFAARSLAAAPAKGDGAPLAWAVGVHDKGRDDPDQGAYPQPATARWQDGAWQTVGTPSFRFPDPVPAEPWAALDAVAVAEGRRGVWALGEHTFNHGEVEDEPAAEDILLQWDGSEWRRRRVPKLSRGFRIRTTVADGAGGLLLDSDHRFTPSGDVHKIASPPHVAGPDGSTPTARGVRRSGQSMVCHDTCLVPGTRTVVAVGAVEFTSDTTKRPSRSRRPMVARYDAPEPS